MNDLGFARPFRLRPGGIDCNVDGLSVGDVALLERDAGGAWRRREEGDLNRELSALYGFALECGGLCAGLEVAATALEKGDLARAQIAALLLRLPEPPTGLPKSALEKRRLAHDLAARGLLKSDADCQAKPQRMGEPLNADSFAPKDWRANTSAPDLPGRPSESDETGAFGKGAGALQAGSETAVGSVAVSGARAEKASADDPKHPGWPAKTPGGLGGKFRPKTDEERAAGLGHNQGPPLDEPDPSGWRGRLLRAVKLAIGKWLRFGVRTAVVGLEVGAVAARIGVRAAEISNPEALIATILAELAAQGFEAAAPYVRAYFDGPKSLEDLQKSANTPQPGYDIHHVVERNTAAPDGSEDALINAPDNLVRIPTVKHWELNRWYDKPSKEFGMSPRQYLKGKSWQERYRVGLDGLRNVGVLK